MYRTVRGNRTRGSTQKITHNTKSFGIMGGLAPQRNASVSTLRGYREGHAQLKQRIPLAPAPGLDYMQGNNPMSKYLLSKNPVGSGGVGNMIPNIPCCSAGTLVNLPKKDVIMEESTALVPVDPVDAMVAALPLEGQQLWNEMDPETKEEWKGAIREAYDDRDTGSSAVYPENISVRHPLNKIIMSAPNPYGTVCTQTDSDSQICSTCPRVCCSDNPVATKSNLMWFGKEGEQLFYNNTQFELFIDNNSYTKKQTCKNNGWLQFGFFGLGLWSQTPRPYLFLVLPEKKGYCNNNNNDTKTVTISKTFTNTLSYKQQKLINDFQGNYCVMRKVSPAPSDAAPPTIEFYQKSNTKNYLIVIQQTSESDKSYILFKGDIGSAIECAQQASLQKQQTVYNYLTSEYTWEGGESTNFDYHFLLGWGEEPNVNCTSNFCSTEPPGSSPDCKNDWNNKTSCISGHDSDCSGNQRCFNLDWQGCKNPKAALHGCYDIYEAFGGWNIHASTGTFEKDAAPDVQST